MSVFPVTPKLFIPQKHLVPLFIPEDYINVSLNSNGLVRSVYLCVCVLVLCVLNGFCLSEIHSDSCMLMLFNQGPDCRLLENSGNGLNYRASSSRPHTDKSEIVMMNCHNTSKQRTILSKYP